MVYLPTRIVDFYGIHVGKYIVRPMDPSWGCKNYTMGFFGVEELYEPGSINSLYWG